MSRFLLAFLCVLSSFFLSGQKSSEKYGKISPSELKSNSCPIDSEAESYYIFDKGDYEIKLDNSVIHRNNTQLNGGFYNFRQRHYRKKFLKETGAGEQINIFLLHSNEEKESITSFNAQILTWKDGKIEKKKVDMKSSVSDVLAPDIDRVTIYLPELEEGAVLEVKYTVKSPFLQHLKTWYFQDDIPKIYCELKLTIPEYYVYDYRQLGFVGVQMEVKQREYEQELTLKDNGLQNVVSESSSSKGQLSYDLENRRYWAENVRPLKDYDFVRSKRNFLSRIQIELISTKYMWESMLELATTWEERNDILLQRHAFGRNLSNSDHVEELAYTVRAQAIDKHEQAVLAHRFISTSMQHVSDANTIFSSVSAKNSYANKRGNSTDINMNLILLLRSLDIQSYPVIISSQENGLIDPYTSSSYDYDYVIAGLTIDSVEYLMDATSTLSCLDLLPTRCLNDYGRTVVPGEGKVVNLMGRKRATYNSSFDSTIELDGSAHGNGMLRLQDYATYETGLNGNSGMEALGFIESIYPKLRAKGKVQDSAANTSTTLMTNVTFDYESNFTSESDHLIQFRPVLNRHLSSTPFTDESRGCPIEFDYPMDINESYTYKLPANMTIENLPEPLIISTPGDGMKFRYQATQIGDMIMVQASYERSQLTHSQLNYDIVRGFYIRMNEKVSEEIVLKKAE